MRLLTISMEAQLHREAYVGILNSLLKRPGNKQELARRAGITPVYLSYILKLERDPYDDSNKAPIIRTPSPKVADRIVRSVSAPPEVRDNLLHHMILASERRVRANRLVQTNLLNRSVTEVVDDVKLIHRDATFATSSAQAKQLYRSVRDMGSIVLKQIPLEVDPLAFVDLCLLIHDAQCILNRPDDALWHAKLAHFIIDSLDSSQYRTERERFDYLAINAVRSEAVAYHNLDIYSEATSINDLANTMMAMKQRPEFWKPHIYRDQIKAMAKSPRFAISEIEYLADEARAICEHRGDDYDALLLLLNSEALAHAYIRHQNYKDAERVLRSELNRIDQAPHIGPLHRVMFLGTFAKLCWAKQDKSGGRHFAKQAHVMAIEAGLDHQAAQIQAEAWEYGEDNL